MMSAPVGSMPNVIGSSMVMVAIGPTPGSTPIRVPTRQPRKQSNTFFSDSATASPSARLLKRSAIGDAQTSDQCDPGTSALAAAFSAS